ncbi:MAG TPA: RNase adapter RapZ [Vicinamibacterales bacterium]|nr:RNase adapter RapZ [Vicinamibacterales bacterium]
MKPKPARFIVLTGLSGSGKSHAIRALEDLGYFCVDNLPTSLIPTLADLVRREGISRVAIVVDIREKSFLNDFPKVFRKLRGMKGLNPALIFLEASHETLVRRFSETRRPHPMAPDKSPSEGIRAERQRMRGIRSMADQIIDTSALTVHQLRQTFAAFSGVARSEKAKLAVNLISFGFKHGLPMDADLVFDVRFLPNPHFVQRLRPKTGRDPEVVKFMEEHAATGELLDRLTDLLKFLVPQYVAEGKSYLTIGIGCTGGRHRSVMVAEKLRKALARLPGSRVRVQHRDIANIAG